MWWIAGVVLIGLVGVDVFFTVFHPHAHGGPFNRFVVRVVWWFTGWMRHLPRVGRDRALSTVGPAIAIATLLGWGLALVTAFALIYVDTIDSLIFTEVRSSRWVEAFYYSTMMLSTLGLGDVVPATPLLRLVSVAQAIVGFILVSVAVSYVIGVYGAHRITASLALDIHTLFGEDAHDGAQRVLRGIDAFDTWADSTARKLNELTVAFAQYPILQYFRPQDRSKSLLVQVGSLLRLFEAMDRRSTVAFGLDRHPSIHALREAVGAYLAEVSEFFIQEDTDLPEGATERRARQHERAMDEMGYDYQREETRRLE